MKFIFDFDDVLFHTTKHFKENIFLSLEKAGIPRNLVLEYLEKNPNFFSLRKTLAHFSAPSGLYEEIMEQSKIFVNNELIELIKKLGKYNCYIVTYGEEEWQNFKIKKSGINKLFSEIIVVLGSKKEAVEKICAAHKDEEVIFIDDREKHFKDLDFKKYPNLQTLLYDEKGFEKLTSILSHS